jgi:hypothetical protein
MTPLFGRRDLLVSLLVGLTCLVIFNANGRAISAGDTYPARYLPFGIWHHHSLRLDPIEDLTAQGRSDTAFWIAHLRDGHSVSLYPVVLPVLLSPLYLPAVLYLDHQGWTDQRVDQLARIMEKLCASLLAALSAALLYLLLRRRASERTALLLTVAYAFGTTTWVISSQALWQHGLAQLLVVGCLLLLTGPCTPARAIVAGLLCGALGGNRPPDAILAAALGVFGLFWAGRRAAHFVAAGVLTAGLVLFYNLHFAHNVAGAYGLRGNPSFFDHDAVIGILGILFSPMRGLFVFSPFLLVLFFAWRHLPTARSERGLTLALTAGVAVQLFLYAKSDWRAGISWGPRFLTDLLPMLIWLSVPVVASLRGVAKGAFALAVCASIAIEAVGAFRYTGESDLPLYADPRYRSFDCPDWPSAVRPAWEWRNAPFLASLRFARPPAELLLHVRGSFDGIEAGGHAVKAVEAGDEVALTGWALVDHHSPWKVSVIVDSRQPFTTRTFTDRPDVRQALGDASPAGWRIALPTAGLSTGTHRLSAFAWGSENGQGRLLAERTLRIAPPRPPAPVDLDASARLAQARLLDHQQTNGAWLTAFTGTTSFTAPREELNTFLTSLLVDLLEPLTSDAALQKGVQRARRHLTHQIEPGGLVRYHGLPNAPGIGTLGCVITPDTDDTALVWRIAPGADLHQRALALATIKRYRTPDGLYRSWLAPRKSYRCIDPGKDPNPTDIGIQLHLFLLLAEVRPPAAQALCEALRENVDRDRIWVYYRAAPLVPLLRLDELRRHGCDLTLPAARLHPAVPEQAIWLSAVERLRRGVDASSEAETRALLSQLARNDFAALRENPPLLYHNDLTATVRRYYWSEDVGYALWLRLQEDHERLARSHVGD